MTYETFVPKKVDDRKAAIQAKIKKLEEHFSKNPNSSVVITRSITGDMPWAGSYTFDPGYPFHIVDIGFDHVMAQEAIGDNQQTSWKFDLQEFALAVDF